ncbi:MAG: RNA polymerase sigma factor [Sandaracinaceae bacterium]
MTDAEPPSHCAPEVKGAGTTVDALPTSATPAFDAVYAEHAAFLYAVLRRLGLGPTAAEDALQDVFVIVHKKLPTFEGRGTLRSWLYGIAVRVAREHRRKRSLFARWFDALSRRDELERANDDPHGDPHAALSVKRAAAQLDQLLSGLAPERREIYVLIEVAELSVPEAAEVLGINLNTTYSRLRLARADVASALARLRAVEARETR